MTRTKRAMLLAELFCVSTLVIGAAAAQDSAVTDAASPAAAGPKPPAAEPAGATTASGATPDAAPKPAPKRNVLINWADFIHGETSLTIAVITPSIEFFALGYNTRHKDLEVGKLFPVKGGKFLVGGYLVSFPDTNKYFLLPWVVYNDKFGKAQLNVNLAQYVPLNGGPRIFFSTESSLVYPIGKKFELGISGSFARVNGGETPFSIGPTLRYKLKNSILKINYQPFAVNSPLSVFGHRSSDLGAVPSKVRLQVTSFF